MKIIVLLPVTDTDKEKFSKVAPNAEIIYRGYKTVTKDDVADAEIIIGNIYIPLLKDAVKLKWLQLNSAGSDEYIVKGVLPEGTLLTNATGAYGLSVAEHMLAGLMSLQKRLYMYRDNQNLRQWKDEGKADTIVGAVTVILGLGDIGCVFAKKMKALGSYVIGVRRTVSDKPDCVDEIYTMESINQVLKRADIVAAILPNTKDTNGLFNKEMFDNMKEGSYFLNVGRGSLVEQEALAEVLNTGKLRGAFIDVTTPEPLPEDHILWNCKNLIITPHAAGSFHLDVTLENIINIAINNLVAYQDGEQLQNVVDWTTGYRKRV
jgi:Phosphoglycerate dehydrogenase and related dehydrogenases